MLPYPKWVNVETEKLLWEKMAEGTREQRGGRFQTEPPCGPPACESEDGPLWCSEGPCLEVFTGRGNDFQRHLFMNTPSLHQAEFGGLLFPVTGESLPSLRHSPLALTQLSLLRSSPSLLSRLCGATNPFLRSGIYPHHILR